MFGLDVWFLYAVLSAVTGGLYIFTVKVAVERGYDRVIFNTIGPLLSAIILLVLTGFFASYDVPSGYLLLFAALNAVFYMAGSLVRYDALACIDTAIFYPLYKTLSPIFAIIAGVFLFAESFTQTEWYGLALSLTVPLLLISSHEKHRQKNLSRGLWLLVLSALLAAIVAVVLKLGTGVVDNLWLFAGLSHVGLALVGFALLSRNKSSRSSLQTSHKKWEKEYVVFIAISGFTHAFSFIFYMLALSKGALAVVYTIQSLYILIPIVLSIIFYNEHWNIRKIIAIVLSILALALFQ